METDDDRMTTMETIGILVKNHGPITSGELAKMACRSPIQVRRILGVLMKMKQVDRRRSLAGDARIILYFDITSAVV